MVKLTLWDQVCHCAPDMPTPPDPRDTAQASTSTNVGTAVANAMLGNVNQVTPQGTRTTEQTGSYDWFDPYTGQTYTIPTFTQTTAYSPEQQRLYELGNQAQQNLGQLAVSQSSRLNELLGTPFSLDGAPKVTAPQYTQFATSPNFTSYAAAPELATSFGDAGAINSNYLTSFGDAGGINKTFLKEFDDAGAITRSYNGDFSEDRDRVEAAMWARQQPYIDQRQEALESRLTNRGIRAGSTAYSGAQGDMAREVNDARLATIAAAGQEQSRLVGMERDRAVFENAAQQQDFAQKATRAQFANQGLQFENDAQAQEFGQLLSRAQFTNQGIQLGNAAQQQRFEQLLQRATFGNTALQQNFLNQFNVTQANNANAQQSWSNNFQATQGNNSLETQRLAAEQQARNQYLQEQYALRNQPINEISALLSGSQVQNPMFGNPQMPQIPTTDTAGLINNHYNQQVNQAMAQYQAQQGILGGLFSLGTAALMPSDRRVKKNVRKIGRIRDTNVYEYRYKGQDRHAPKTIGVMAQEIERKTPDAVVEIGGVKHVDYGKVVDGLLAYGAAA